MALLYATGWDLFGTFAFAATSDGWFSQLTGNAAGASCTLDTANGRFGGTCLNINNGSSNGGTFSQRQFGNQGLGGAHTYVGFAYNASGGSTLTMTLDDGIGTTGAVNQLRILVGGPNVVLQNGPGTTLATATNVARTGVYNYVELDAVIGTGTSGSAIVRCNGVTVITQTGIALQQTANQRWNVLTFYTFTNGAQRMDDLYVCDGTGSQNNALLGDVSLAAILPSNDGTNSAFTQVGGTAGHNYTSVNENPNNGDTSYVTSGVLNAVDTYQYAALPGNTANVLAVIAKYVARKDDTGIRHITAHYRESGTEADFTATDMNLIISYAAFTQIQEINPVTTSAWVPTDISSGEFGFKVSV